MQEIHFDSHINFKSDRFEMSYYNLLGPYLGTWCTPFCSNLMFRFGCYFGSKVISFSFYGFEFVLGTKQKFVLKSFINTSNRIYRELV